MKEATLERKIRKINDSLDRLESGRYCDVSMSWICDQIAWLAKFKYLQDESLNTLVDRATELLDKGIY